MIVKRRLTVTLLTLSLLFSLLLAGVPSSRRLRRQALKEGATYSLVPPNMAPRTGRSSWRRPRRCRPPPPTAPR